MNTSTILSGEFEFEIGHVLLWSALDAQSGFILGAVEEGINDADSEIPMPSSTKFTPRPRPERASLSHNHHHRTHLFPLAVMLLACSGMCVSVLFAAPTTDQTRAKFISSIADHCGVGESNESYELTSNETCDVTSIIITMILGQIDLIKEERPINYSIMCNYNSKQTDHNETRCFSNEHDREYNRLFLKSYVDFESIRSVNPAVGHLTAEVYEELMKPLKDMFCSLNCFNRSWSFEDIEEYLHNATTDLRAPSNNSELVTAECRSLRTLEEHVQDFQKYLEITQHC